MSADLASSMTLEILASDLDLVLSKAIGSNLTDAGKVALEATIQAATNLLDNWNAIASTEHAGKVGFHAAEMASVLTMLDHREYPLTVNREDRWARGIRDAMLDIRDRNLVDLAELLASVTKEDIDDAQADHQVLLSAFSLLYEGNELQDLVPEDLSALGLGLLYATAAVLGIPNADPDPETLFQQVKALALTSSGFGPTHAFVRPIGGEALVLQPACIVKASRRDELMMVYAMLDCCPS